MPLGESLMPQKTMTILGWTGRGRLADLESSVVFVLGERGVKGRVSRTGTSVNVEGPEPLGVAALLGHMPGVAWVAAGGAARSALELAALGSALAKKYLRKGDRFIVEAKGEGEVLASDIGGSITSKILESVKGSRVSIESPNVLFRVVFDGARGVVGVEVKKGPGGMPTGGESATCLVSGGKHSSVVAWHAVLLGFRVRLVHAKVSDESLRAVAELYSELSHRADPRWLRLEVLEGDSILGALSGYAGRSKDRLFGGLSRSGGQSLLELPGTLAPLYLTPEERFQAEFEALGIKSYDLQDDWKRKGQNPLTVRGFGGITADVSEVLDGLQ
jgi:hypothetical protein